MRIAFHVFSILGAGHLQRARAIAAALAPHDVIWLGHRPAGAPGELVAQPLAVTAVPPSPQEAATCIRIGQQLARQITEQPPDVLVTEHFPFGSDIFDDGFLPILQAAKAAGVPIVASVRDILGKDRDHLAWAQRATKILNYWYEAILWHGDRRLLGFDFPLLAHVRPRVLPTGYVRVGTSPPWQPEPRHWVASCGAGRGEGLQFCLAVLNAQDRLAAAGWRLTLIAGRENHEHLHRQPITLPAGTTLLPWTDDLPGLLATATLSVSQCGYNTSLEVLASGAPGVFVPFVEPRNEEQRLRAEVIARCPGYRVLSLFDPQLVSRLAETVAALEGEAARPPQLDMQGADASARMLVSLSGPSYR
jgi:predicted glycosyltransferase